MGPTTVVVARHARAAYVEDWFSDEGGSLTGAGRDQALTLARSLADQGIVAVVTSDVSRAVQTGEIAAHHLGVGVTAYKSLREVFIGDLLGQAFDVGLLEQVTVRWYAGDLDARFPGGESGTEVVDRHRAQLEAVADAHPGQRVLVVGHQTALGIAVPTLARDVTPAWARAHALENTQSVELRREPATDPARDPDGDGQGWVLTRWGEQRLDVRPRG